jgi:hypothetical protein
MLNRPKLLSGNTLMKVSFPIALFATLMSGCGSSGKPSSSDATIKANAAFSVSIYCEQYEPNPGSLKGEVRLHNGTSSRITAKVARENGTPQEHTIDAGRHVRLAYLGWADLPCNHNFRVVSWK